MSVMVTGNLLARQDLDALPDDGLRHELIDGVIIVSPSPGRPHQRMVGGIYRLLWDHTEGTEFETLLAPFDVVLGPHVVVPDIVVAFRSAFTDRDLPTAPLLVVEVRSPSTGWIDEGRKRQLYQDYAISSYWLVDPAVPSITVLELIDGTYTEVACATGDQTIEVTEPVTVTLNPASLIRA